MKTCAHDIWQTRGHPDLLFCIAASTGMLLSFTKYRHPMICINQLSRVARLRCRATYHLFAFGVTSLVSFIWSRSWNWHLAKHHIPKWPHWGSTCSSKETLAVIGDENSENTETMRPFTWHPRWNNIDERDTPDLQ